jgi:hypothetical protein
MIVINNHDHGYPMIMVVSFFQRRSHVVMMDGCLWTPVRIVVVGGGYLLPRNAYMLGLWSNSYFQGEGAIPMPCRPWIAFPPSYLFKFYGLDDWVILLLGLCHLFLGLSPVQVLLLFFCAILVPLFQKIKRLIWFPIYLSFNFDDMTYSLYEIGHDICLWSCHVIFNFLFII